MRCVNGNVRYLSAGFASVPRVASSCNLPRGEVYSENIENIVLLPRPRIVGRGYVVFTFRGFRVSSLFTLVELVLVIAIIAVVASFVIPILGGVVRKSTSEVVVYEMGRIRGAFSKLDSDCSLSDVQLADIAEYGLWPLSRMEHPADSAKDIPEFDPDRNRGWRGPYAKRRTWSR